jgi:hypothetical protein
VRVAAAGILVLAVMTGCMHRYSYDVEAHNSSSSEPIAMNVVRRLPNDEARSVFYTEIVPDTSSGFVFCARTKQRWDVVEARFRRPTDEAWVRREVASGTPARLDVRVEDGHVVVTDAGASDVGSYQPDGGGGARGSPDR